ncbi:unnamed protein product [Auanema sp. JU1783]|nr:unnamed protein product [Auanema sp. JU1783]
MTKGLRIITALSRSYTDRTFVMMSVGPQHRDQATAALFQRIIREKAQERELLKCPRCFDLMEALPLEIDDQGYQTVWWVCKSTGKKKCDFPLDMPTDVFWIKRSPTDIKDGYMPRPKIELLPSRYRYLYPALFAHAMKLSQSRCSSVTSRSSTATLSSRSSLHTCDMPLSGIPSPLTPTNDWEGSITPSSNSVREESRDSSSRNSCEPTPSTSDETNKGSEIVTRQAPKAKATRKRKEVVPENDTAAFEPVNEKTDESEYEKAAYRAVRKRVDERIAKRNKIRRRTPHESCLSTLFTQIKNLDLTKLNIEELETILEKCDIDMRMIDMDDIKKRQERAEVSRDFYSTLDLTKIENQVHERTAVDKLNMLYSLRNSHDGTSLMAALGAESTQMPSVIVVGQNEDREMQDFIKNRMKDISILIRKKKIENAKQNSKQEKGSHAAIDKRSNALSTTISDLSLAEIERKKAAKLEYEHKTKALVQSKVAAHLEAKRKKLLASKDLMQNMPATHGGSQESMPDPFYNSSQQSVDLFDYPVPDRSDLMMNGDNQDLQAHQIFNPYGDGDLSDYNNPFSSLEIGNSFYDFPI